jgi:hypothetical protein
MFKPGQNVQARELTTLQSILQNQVERFGKHIFENGSLVSGGEISVSNGFYARIDSERPLSDSDLRSLIGRKITTTDVVADTIATVVSVSGTPAGTDDATSLTNDNEQIVFFNYSNAGTFTGSVFSTTADNLTGITFESASSFAPRTGTVSNIVSVEKGIYFVDGYFALNDQQSFAAYGITSAYRNFDRPSASIGFDVSKSIVDVSEDSTLNDPAAGFNNFNAPGADRFKIDPTLVQRSLTGTGDAPSLSIAGTTTDYIELVRTDEGNVSKKVKFAQYGDLLRTLARRTFDESGNYTVKPFTLTIDDHQSVFGSVDATKLGVVLSPGKAYVSGYEFETSGPTKFVLDKARTTQKINQVTLNTEESTFVETDEYTLPVSGVASESDLIDGGEFAIFGIDGDTKTFIGRCNIKNIRPSTRQQTDGNPPFLKFHIHRIAMEKDSAGKVISLFRQPKLQFINITTTQNTGRGGGTPSYTVENKFTFSTSTPGQDVRNLNSGRSIFKLPNTFATAAIDGLSHQFRFNVTKMFRGTTTNGGVAEINLPSGTTNVNFIDSSSNIVVIATDTSTGANGTDAMSVATVNSVEIDTVNKVMRLSLDSDKFSAATFVANVPLKYEDDANNRTIRTATLVSETITVDPDSGDDTLYVMDGQGNNGYVTALFDVQTILDSNGNDVTSKFIIDDGQRIDVYDFARLTLAKGESLVVAGDTLTVTLRRFAHSQAQIGSALTRQSYASIPELDTYDKSPVFNDPDTGETLRLFDAVDFRPRRRSPSVGDFDYSGFESTIPFEFNSDPSNVSFTTFLPRIDVITLGEDRTLRKIEGTPSLSPVAPVVNDRDMELYRIFIDAFTIDDNSTSVKFINTQRFTMQDIGDIEDTTFNDSEFIYRQSLEAKAISAALGLFPGAENVDSGVFVDDLIGHANADVTKPQYNVSIDPVTATLHPPFQTFSRSGTLAGGQNNTIYNTNYGRVVTAAGVTTNFVENTVEDSGAGITLSPNPFGIVDYLGSIKLNPSFDRYWSETKAAKVIVNVAGENNAWKKAISAPTGVDGKRLGFGTQWKDWESIWFGRLTGDEADVSSTLSDPDNIQYRSNNTRSGFVRRVLAEKITNKIGDRIVDLSIVPYMQAVTIDGLVEGVRPNSTHYLYFDDNLIGATAAGYLAGTTGSFNFSVTIPSDVYLTGEKLVQVTNGLTNGDISTATSSADATFYALGNYQTSVEGVNSVRPPIRRRDASNTDSFLGAEYTDSVGGVGVNVFNSLDPLSQTFTVDANLFNDGLCLEKVRLSFASKPDDTTGGVVTVQIRPVDDNGSPRRNFVVPFSEKTLSPNDITVGTLTDFEFECPVYLGPGTYAISVLTNDSSYTLNTTGTPSPNSPLQRLFVSRNDGQRTVYSDTSLVCTLVRHSFVVDTTETVFTPSDTFAASLVPSAMYFANAKNILSSATINAVFDLDTVNNVTSIPNKTITFLEQDSARTNNVTLSFLPSEKVSPIIDESQCKLLNIASFTSTSSNPDSEQQATDQKSDSIATYYSKIVTLNTAADNLNVRIAGVLTDDAQVDVYAKVSGESNADLETAPYVRLVSQPGASSTSSSNREVVVQNFATVREVLAEGGEDVDIESGLLGTFTQYMFKVVITNKGTQARDLPKITSIAAVPLGKKITSEFFESITPTGSIVSYVGGGAAPDGWRYCDGSVLIDDGTGGQNADLRSLIGDKFNITGDPSGTVRLPDLRSRVPIGSRDSADQDLDNGLKLRTFGATGGSHKLQGHDHGNPRISNNGKSLRPANSRIRMGSGVGDDNNGVGLLSYGKQGENSGGEGSGQEGRIKLIDGRDADGNVTSNGNGDVLNDRGLLIRHGTDLAGAELDNRLTESMPPFLVLNYIIKL